MIVLGFDTATPATAVALRLADGRVLEGRDDPGARTGPGAQASPGAQTRPGHATRLLPLADELLKQAGLDWGELERIAVGVGPGTFTGLRIGVATARGLAQSLAVTAVAVSSLQALAHTATEQLNEDAAGVLSVIDARRGEVFVAAYRGVEEVLPPRPLPPERLTDVLAEARARTGTDRWAAVGDGAVRYRQELPQPDVFVPEDHSHLHRVSGAAICALGLHAPIDPDGSLVPDYRRRPDAELTLEGATSA